MFVLEIFLSENTVQINYVKKSWNLKNKVLVYIWSCSEDLRDDEKVKNCWLSFTKAPPLMLTSGLEAAFSGLLSPSSLPPDQFCIRPLCFHYNLAARAPLNRKSEWRQFFPLTIYFPLGSLAHYCSSFLKGAKNPKKTVFSCEALL